MRWASVKRSSLSLMQFLILLVYQIGFVIDFARVQVAHTDSFFDDLFVSLIQQDAIVLKIRFDPLLFLLQAPGSFFKADILQAPGFGKIFGNGLGEPGGLTFTNEIEQDRSNCDGAANIRIGDWQALIPSRGITNTAAAKPIDNISQSQRGRARKSMTNGWLR